MARISITVGELPSRFLECIAKTIRSYALQADQFASVTNRSNRFAQISLRRAIQFQPHCDNCFVTPTDNEDRDIRRFKVCSDCHLTFFCSQDCHRAGIDLHRQKECRVLQDLAFSELFRLERFKTDEDMDFMLPVPSPRSDYKPLSSISSWKQYYEEFSGYPFGHFLTDDFNPAGEGDDYIRTCRIAKIATNASTYCLTILAGLESLISDLPARKELIIHIMGADAKDFGALKMTEDLLHLLPELRSLVICCIGPDVPIQGDGTDELMDIECCPECTHKGRTRRLLVKRNLYHNFIKSSAFVKNPPDLVVAFNSGHHDEDSLKSWTPTLKAILERNIPALFTTYNESEAFQERISLGRLGARFVREPSQNPWRGALAYPDKLEGRYAVYHTNGFWYIVQGRIGVDSAKSGS